MQTMNTLRLAKKTNDQNTKNEKLRNIKILMLSMLPVFSAISDSKYTHSIPLKREAVISIGLNENLVDLHHNVLTSILPLPTNEQESILCI